MPHPADALPDYYALLQVVPQADPEVVEGAYKRLSLKNHPDRNRAPEAAAVQRRLNEAYEVLRDPARRRAYDRLRQQAAEAGAAQTAPPAAATPPAPTPDAAWVSQVAGLAVLGTLAVVVIGAVGGGLGLGMGKKFHWEAAWLRWILGAVGGGIVAVPRKADGAAEGAMSDRDFLRVLGGAAGGALLAGLEFSTWGFVIAAAVGAVGGAWLASAEQQKARKFADVHHGTALAVGLVVGAAFWGVLALAWWWAFGSKAAVATSTDPDPAAATHAGNPPSGAPVASISASAIRAMMEIDQGKEAFKAGNPDLAITHFDEALRLYPKAGLVYLLRSRAYALKGDRIRALADYEEAIRLDPALAKEAKP